jgi:hypothetical protein
MLSGVFDLPWRGLAPLQPAGAPLAGVSLTISPSRHALA